jgi:hypothetical protein
MLRSCSKLLFHPGAAQAAEAALADTALASTSYALFQQQRFIRRKKQVKVVLTQVRGAQAAAGRRPRRPSHACACAARRAQGHPARHASPPPAPLPNRTTLTLGMPATWWA